ncbi:MAG: hypothetical protein ACYTKD_29475 [Planctomycetota bacterium]|jgi:hypothetical protein
MSGRASARLRCLFTIAGEGWLLEGLDAASLGPWARDARARDVDAETGPDVRVRARPESAAARKAGVSGSPGGGYRLTAEDFACEVSASLDQVEIRGEAPALADGVRAGVRLGALLRCRAGGGLALHASCVARGDGRDARAFVLAGPTGAGKTTAAGHAAAAGARVIADDLVMLRRDGDAPEWRASGLPWEAGARVAGENAPVRAAALVRIVQGAEYGLARVRGARAAALALACPPESLGVETGRIVISTARMVDELAVFRATLPEGPEAVRRMLDDVRGK